MKKLRTSALALAALVVFTIFGVAQQKDMQKSPPTSVEAKQAMKGEKNSVKATPQRTRVKVMEVNNNAKTLTVMANGKMFTFDAKSLKSFPKPGEMIDMWGEPTGQPGQRLVCTVVECDMGWGSGPCIKCFDYQLLRMSGKVTEVNEKAKTFTILSKGKTFTIDGKNLKSLPKPGEMIDFTYTQTPGGPMQATNLNSSRSNVN